MSSLSGPRYNPPSFWPIAVLMGFLAFLIIMLFTGLKISGDQWEAQQKKDYADCKARTMDIEWCFSKFHPNI